MPHFIRTMLHGNPTFAIDWNFSKKNRLRERLGAVGNGDVIEITDAEADKGIDALRAKYFSDAEPEVAYHGA